jgi:hypothetical protein
LLGVIAVSFSGDGVSSMTIQSGRNSCIQVSVVEGSDALVVVYKKGAQASKNTAAIEECVRALRHGTCGLALHFDRRGRWTDLCVLSAIPSPLQCAY